MNIDNGDDPKIRMYSSRWKCAADRDKDRGIDKKGAPTSTYDSLTPVISTSMKTATSPTPLNAWTGLSQMPSRRESIPLDNQAPFQVEGIPMQALRIQSSVGNAEMRSLRMSRSLATPCKPTPVKLGPPQKHWVDPP